ncbi:NADPH:quinone reductase [Mycobacterium sp. 1245111.1]|uniref:NADPH:quinone reductase n=1 Tax=Mycobacterium sp. 1245111.1 TaxID=1834073 RepID=UPI00080236A1|nr:NADPH:quinone reductase [Mycobacterium sp. 1245111.1]OBK35383.1 NADPH:quinone reductase [Mycobacterium sp. 1245111.1]
MKSIVYTHAGDPSVLTVVERPVPAVNDGEVRVKMAVSGVNPTDWKARQDRTANISAGGQVPNQDGAGVVDAVGDGVTGLKPGDRVWVWDAAWQRSDGTAQQFVSLPAAQVVPLPDNASFDVGASMGIPALTAHRALTSHRSAPMQLRPGALSGLTVLVAGGAGAVGHAAIQLGVWAGAAVVTTVSSDEKAELCNAAGAHQIINYRRQQVATELQRRHPRGADIIVEVNLRANVEQDLAMLARDGAITVYASDDQDTIPVPTRAGMMKNARLQYILTYLTDYEAKLASVRAVNAAIADGAMEVGRQAGLPLHRYGLERTADAHRASEAGVVGKVLIDVP